MIRAMFERRVETRLAALVGLLLAALFLGGYVGNHLAWGTKTLTVSQGQVTWHTADTNLISFTSPDGPTMSVNSNISWATTGAHGEGRPPCLRLGQTIDAEVGYTWVAEPDGGSHPVVAWIRCP